MLKFHKCRVAGYISVLICLLDEAVTAIPYAASEKLKNFAETRFY